MQAKLRRPVVTWILDQPADRTRGRARGLDHLHLAAITTATTTTPIVKSAEKTVGTLEGGTTVENARTRLA